MYQRADNDAVGLPFTDAAEEELDGRWTSLHCEMPRFISSYEVA